MTFSIRNLAVLAHAQGFTLWHYKATNTAMAEIKRSGYFSGAADMLAAGDMLMISAADSGSVAFIAETGGEVSLVALA